MMFEPYYKYVGTSITRYIFSANYHKFNQKSHKTCPYVTAPIVTIDC